MRSDFVNPFSTRRESGIILGDKELVIIHLDLVAELAAEWLKRIEKSRTPLTAAFHRSLQGNSLLRMLPIAEATFNVPCHAADPIEKRLVAVAAAAAKEQYDLTRWESFLPKLQATVTDPGLQGAGPVASAKIIRDGLRKG